MSKSSLDWNVVHYGFLVASKDIVVDGNIITTKVYLYQDDYFIETWCNGIRLLFHQVI